MFPVRHIPKKVVIQPDPNKKDIVVSINDGYPKTEINNQQLPNQHNFQQPYIQPNHPLMYSTVPVTIHQANIHTSPLQSPHFIPTPPPPYNDHLMSIDDKFITTQQKENVNTPSAPVTNGNAIYPELNVKNTEDNLDKNKSRKKRDVSTNVLSIPIEDDLNEDENIVEPNQDKKKEQKKYKKLKNLILKNKNKTDVKEDTIEKHNEYVTTSDGEDENPKKIKKDDTHKSDDITDQIIEGVVLLNDNLLLKQKKDVYTEEKAIPNKTFITKLKNLHGLSKWIALLLIILLFYQQIRTPVMDLINFGNAIIFEKQNDTDLINNITNGKNNTEIIANIVNNTKTINSEAQSNYIPYSRNIYEK